METCRKWKSRGQFTFQSSLIEFVIGGVFHFFSPQLAGDRLIASTIQLSVDDCSIWRPQTLSCDPLINPFMRSVNLASGGCQCFDDWVSRARNFVVPTEARSLHLTWSGLMVVSICTNTTNGRERGAKNSYHKRSQHQHQRLEKHRAS